MNTSTSAGFPKMKLISNGYPLNTAQDMDTTQLETEKLSTLRKTKDNHTDVVGVVLSLSSLNLNVAPIVTTDTLANSRPDTAPDEFQSSHLTGSTSILIDGNTTTNRTLDVSEDDFTLSSLMDASNGAADTTVELQPHSAHRYSVKLISTPGKSIGCSSPDESLGLKTANFLEIITIPVTNFSCQGRGQGYFVDSDISCRVFHYCQDASYILSFICPTCTLFHEEKQLCDFWYNVECKNTFLMKTNSTNID